MRCWTRTTRRWRRLAANGSNAPRPSSSGRAPKRRSVTNLQYARMPEQQDPSIVCKDGRSWKRLTAARDKEREHAVNPTVPNHGTALRRRHHDGRKGPRGPGLSRLPEPACARHHGRGSERAHAQGLLWQRIRARRARTARPGRALHHNHRGDEREAADRGAGQAAVAQARARGLRDGDEVRLAIEPLPCRNPRAASYDGLSFTSTFERLRAAAPSVRLAACSGAPLLRAGLAAVFEKAGVARTLHLVDEACLPCTPTLPNAVHVGAHRVGRKHQAFAYELHVAAVRHEFQHLLLARRERVGARQLVDGGLPGIKVAGDLGRGRLAGRAGPGAARTGGTPPPPSPLFFQGRAKHAAAAAARIAAKAGRAPAGSRPPATQAMQAHAAARPVAHPAKNAARSPALLRPAVVRTSATFLPDASGCAGRCRRFRLPSSAGPHHACGRPGASCLHSMRVPPHAAQTGWGSRPAPPRARSPGTPAAVGRYPQAQLVALPAVVAHVAPLHDRSALRDRRVGEPSRAPPCASPRILHQRGASPCASSVFRRRTSPRAERTSSHARRRSASVKLHAAPVEQRLQRGSPAAGSRPTLMSSCTHSSSSFIRSCS